MLFVLSVYQGFDCCQGYRQGRVQHIASSRGISVVDVECPREYFFLRNCLSWVWSRQVLLWKSFQNALLHDQNVVLRTIGEIFVTWSWVDQCLRYSSGRKRRGWSPDNVGNLELWDSLDQCLLWYALLPTLDTTAYSGMPRRRSIARLILLSMENWNSCTEQVEGGKRTERLEIEGWVPLWFKLSFFLVRVIVASSSFTTAFIFDGIINKSYKGIKCFGKVSL